MLQLYNYSILLLWLYLQQFDLLLIRKSGFLICCCCYPLRNPYNNVLGSLTKFLFMKVLRHWRCEKAVQVLMLGQTGMISQKVMHFLSSLISIADFPLADGTQHIAKFRVNLIFTLFLACIELLPRADQWKKFSFLQKIVELHVKQKSGRHSQSTIKCTRNGNFQFSRISSRGRSIHALRFAAF